MQWFRANKKWPTIWAFACHKVACRSGLREAKRRKVATYACVTWGPCAVSTRLASCELSDRALRGALTCVHFVWTVPIYFPRPFPSPCWLLANKERRICLEVATTATTVTAVDAGRTRFLQWVGFKRSDDDSTVRTPIEKSEMGDKVKIR